MKSHCRYRLSVVHNMSIIQKSYSKSCLFFIREIISLLNVSAVLVTFFTGNVWMRLAAVFCQTSYFPRLPFVTRRAKSGLKIALGSRMWGRLSSSRLIHRLSDTGHQIDVSLALRSVSLAHTASVEIASAFSFWKSHISLPNKCNLLYRTEVKIPAFWIHKERKKACDLYIFLLSELLLYRMKQSKSFLDFFKLRPQSS